MPEYPLNVFPETYRGDMANRIKTVADLSYSFHWPELLEVLKENPDMVNVCRLPKDKSTKPKLYTPLHQAALGDAPLHVFEELLKMGASRTLKTAEGETAYDIGVKKSLDPEKLSKIEIPEEIRKKEQEIAKMEAGLHEAINGRAKDLLEKNGQQLPQLGYLFEQKEGEEVWYPVPGMYGGFCISRCDDGVQASSWCRVAGGSGQRHVINKEGKVELVEEGFV